MEIKQFESARNSTLSDFEKTYDSLKREYSSAVMAAIEETDAERQQQLVSRVLSINSDLSNELRQVLTDISKGSGDVPSKTMDDLTADLIRYQKDYSDIEKGKDRLQTLKLINKSNQEKLDDTKLMYNVYIGALVLLIFIVGFLVVKTNWKQAYSSVKTMVPTSYTVTSTYGTR
jgi:hypothetical protein